MLTRNRLPKALVAILTFVTMLASLVVPADAHHSKKKYSSNVTLAYSTAPDRSNPMALNGALIEAGTDVAIFADTYRAQAAVFYVNGKFAKTEQWAPYDLGGTRHDGSAAMLSTDHFRPGKNRVDVFVRSGWRWSRSWTRATAHFDVVESKTAPTIADIALGDDRLTTLVAALTESSASGSVNFLQALADPNADLTVFAPTDAAFELLGPSIETALANPDLLTEVLAYHVLNFPADSASLTQNCCFETLSGGTVFVEAVNDQIFINNALVVTADIEAENGIVHVIDRVLLPELADEEPDFTNLTIAEVIGSEPTLTTLTSALTIASEGPTNFLRVASDPTQDLTVFAPTDAAFAELGPVLDLVINNPRALTNLLSYHIAFGGQTAEQLFLAGGTETLLGPLVTAFANDQGAFVNDARIQVFDLQTENGVIHIIDAVLIPPAPPTEDERVG